LIAPQGIMLGMKKKPREKALNCLLSHGALLWFFPIVADRLGQLWKEGIYYAASSSPPLSTSALSFTRLRQEKFAILGLRAMN